MLLSLVAGVALAQEDPALYFPIDQFDGWSLEQSQWLEAARIGARLSLASGDPEPALSLVGQLASKTPPSGKSAKADADKDRIPDWRDVCPAAPAKDGVTGCPEVGPIVRGAVDGRARDIGMLRIDALSAQADVLSGSPYRDPIVANTGGQGRLGDNDPLIAIGRGWFPPDRPTKKDRDGDGIVDSIDGCPDTGGFRSDEVYKNGCLFPPQADAWEPGEADPITVFTPIEQGTNLALDTLDQFLVPRPVAEKPAPRVQPQAPVVVVAPAKTFPSVDTRLPGGKPAKNDTAVVIGLNKYFAIPEVPYADRDADAFYNFLLYTRGVPQENIQMLSSGSKEHILGAVKKAGEEVGSGGTVWVYFAGHGAANPSTGGRMILGDDVRSDAVSFTTRGVEVTEIERLASTRGGTPMLVLDTCYSGVGRSGNSLIAGTRFAVPQFDSKPVSGMEWNAASADQVSGPFEPARHGAFTYFAVGALRGWADGEIDGKKDGNVSGREAQAYVRRALRANQKNDQQPVWVGPADPVLSEGVREAGPEF